MFYKVKCLVFAELQEDFLSNIVHLFNVGSMLGQRRRCWPSIETALDQCLIQVVSCNQFSGYINAVNLYSIGNVGLHLTFPGMRILKLNTSLTLALVKSDISDGLILG